MNVITELALPLLIILILESILSIDNAAVLSVIVNKKLPKEQRSKALKYGIFGAFAFRGVSLFAVSWLLHNPAVGAWAKVVGGLYLAHLAYTGLTPKKDSIEEGQAKWIERLLNALKINPFWSTVIVVEIVDIVFSLDNLVAVVGVSDNIWIVIVGVSIGIVTMRFVATKFSKLMDRFPLLEKSAFIVIALIAIKLIAGGIVDLAGMQTAKQIFESHLFDIIFSVITMVIFFVPLLFKSNRLQNA